MSSDNHLQMRNKNFNGEYHIEKDDSINLVWIKTQSYNQASSKVRIINWFKFSYKVSKLSKVLNDKPDVILYSSPSLIGYLGAYALARKNNSKIIFEVRDIWPLTLCELGGYSEKNPMIVFLKHIEYFAYKTADDVISNLPNAIAHMETRGLEKQKFHWIPNGYSHTDFYSSEILGDNYTLSISDNKFKIGYCGTIGKANALDFLVKAAEILRNEDIQFIIVGSGSECKTLKDYVKNRKLNNVLILPAVKKSKVSSVLNLFDVCYLGWHNARIYEYGISANKMSEYMLSGKPILHSYSGSRDPVEEFNCGVSVEAENPAEIAQGILSLKRMSETNRKHLGDNGRQAANELFNYERLTIELEKVLFSL